MYTETNTMENNVNHRSIIINYGLILGGLTILLSLTLYAMDKSFNPGIFLGALSFLIPVVLIFLGIKKFKDSNGGFLSWKQAVKMGVGIAVVGTLVALIYQQIFENFIEPDFVNQKTAFLKEQYLDAGLSAEQINTQIKRMSKFNTPLIASALGIMMWAFLGFIISAIIGLIMKKEEDIF